MALEYVFLVPLSDAASEILSFPPNKILLGHNENGQQALVLSPDGRHRDPAIVATAGRANTHNIVLPSSRAYSRHQFTFLHNRLTQELLIEDCSRSGDTRIEYAEEGLWKFEFTGLPRRRVIKQPAELHFHHASFSLHVQSSPALDAIKTMTLSKPVPEDLESSFIHLSLPATVIHTRVHTPLEHSHQDQGIRHYQLRDLGRGRLSTVSETLNVATGDHLAVKTIRVKQKDLDEKTIKEAVKFQIHMLKELSHFNIVAVSHSQGWGLGMNLEVFMTLYKGDLRVLISDHDPAVYTTSFLRTILEVLSFLAERDVIHGDIKLANILFDHYRRFYLTDFGLVRASRAPLDYFISKLYAAPEAYKN